MRHVHGAAIVIVSALAACGCGSDETPASVAAAGGQAGASGGPAAAGGQAGSSGGSAGTGGAGGAAGSTLSGGSSGTGGSTPPADAGTDGSPAAVWRPFNAQSPWNTPIPANPTLDPNSAALIDDFKNSSQWGVHLDVNIDGYSIPLFWADASTPKVLVTCRTGGHGFVGTNGSNATAMVPIPAGAAPDPQSDHHLLIVDRSTDTEYGMWDTVFANGAWTCGLGALLDLNGTGVRPLAKDATPWWEAHGARAWGVGLSAGLIRPEEIAAGRIEHALVVAYPHIRAGMYVPPASTAQGANGVGAQKDRGIPCGGRIQLDPSIDVDAIAVSAAGKAILRALQIYGAYVGDYSGALSLYGDNSPDARAYWQSIGFGSYVLQDKFDLGKLRVIAIGTMYDNGNG
jgi:hypothetical protein